MANEMFIPPLGTPQPSPRNPPVVPPASNAPPPAWAMNHGTPGQYPMMFSSPMIGTPFIPGGATPGALPHLGTPYSASQTMPNGFSADYTGYPQFAVPTPNMGTIPMGQAHHSPWPQQQQSPWHPPHSAPAGTPWQAAGAFPGMQPQSAGWGPPPVLPQGYGPPPAMQMNGMGFPQMMGGGPPMMPMGGGPPMMPMGGPPMIPMMGGGGGGGHWDMGAMGQSLPQPPLARATAVLGEMDHMDEFASGPHYGPVLEPFLTHVLRVVPRLNPLIRPAPVETNDPDHDYLKWNMLWASNMVQRSCDGPHTSWSEGRSSPATFPRITSMRLLPSLLPFTIEIFARDPNIGITCGDVIDAISDSMRKHSGQADFDTLPAARKRIVGEAYRHNRSRAHGVPGGALGDGLRRMDFLGMETMFGGIREDSSAVRRICGEVLPCTWILDCTTRYPMTREEIAAQQAREEALRLEESEREHARREEERDRESRRRSRRSSRVPTVLTVNDDDDDDAE